MNENNQHFIDNIPDLPYSDFKYEGVEITDLIGKIITDIKYTDKEILFQIYDFEENYIYYKFYHQQDCCEDVWLDDIIGDLSDLIDTPVLKAIKKTSSELIIPKKGGLDESNTWTFYTLATIKGYVDLRFIGTSNGYYSEEIDIVKITERN